MTRQTPGPDTRGLGMRVVPPNRGRAVEGAGLESGCDAMLTWITLGNLDEFEQMSQFG